MQTNAQIKEKGPRLEEKLTSLITKNDNYLKCSKFKITKISIIYIFNFILLKNRKNSLFAAVFKPFHVEPYMLGIDLVQVPFK